MQLSHRMMATMKLSVALLVVLLIAAHCLTTGLDLYSQQRLCRLRVSMAPTADSYSDGGGIVHDDMLFIEHNSMGAKKSMAWDNQRRRFLHEKHVSPGESQLQGMKVLQGTFFPSGDLSVDYYRYAFWRALQRFVSATNSVFGTQALLLALGFKTNKLGLAAATTWVLKDALGKVSRIVWASKHGRKFDGDAKKWRFRASFLFAAGNALEIVTFLCPSVFLLAAAAANALKQMAMLTSSATRNTIYKSFSQSSDNIGDITAKGEAQTAVIDLLGMCLGIRISRSTNLAKAKIVMVFLVLSIVDLLCVYQEIRRSVDYISVIRSPRLLCIDHLTALNTLLYRLSVVFKSLNFERCDLVLRQVFQMQQYTHINATSNSIGNNEGYSAVGKSWVDALVGGKGSTSPSSILLTPPEIARREKLLMPARRGESLIQTWGSLRSRDGRAIRRFASFFKSHDERVAVVLHARLLRSWMDGFLLHTGLRQGAEVRLVDGCPVVLCQEILIHKDASPLDIFKAFVMVNRVSHIFSLNSSATTVDSSAAAMMIADRRLASVQDRSQHSSSSSEAADCERDRREQALLHQLRLGHDDLMGMVRESHAYQRMHLQDILSGLQTAGWTTDRFMFGSIKRRVEW